MSIAHQHGAIFNGRELAQITACARPFRARERDDLGAINYCEGISQIVKIRQASLYNQAPTIAAMMYSTTSQPSRSSKTFVGINPNPAPMTLG